MAFQKAVRTKAKARVAISGPSKSGKTMTALRMARGLVGPDGAIAVRDSEHGSASKYAVLDGEAESETAFVFDVIEPDEHSPDSYIKSIQEAEAGGYGVIILDSLSHGWAGKGGVLEIVDSATARAGRKDSFGSGWAVGTPAHNKLMDYINACSIHVIATMRVKMEYALEQNSKGKVVPVKLGLAPVQRDTTEYEFDVMCVMDADHTMHVSGTRCPELENKVIDKPTDAVGQTLAAWLGQGVDAPAPRANGAKANGRTAELTAALDTRTTELIELAAEKSIDGAPQDWDSMRAAIQSTALGFLDIKGAPEPNQFDPLIAAMGNAMFGPDGAVVIPESDVRF